MNEKIKRSKVILPIFQSVCERKILRVTVVVARDDIDRHVELLQNFINFLILIQILLRVHLAKNEIAGKNDKVRVFFKIHFFDSLLKIEPAFIRVRIPYARFRRKCGSAANGSDGSPKFLGEPT